MKLSLATPPAVLPVTRDEAKLQSRILGNAEDTLIDLYIAAATAELDGPTGVVGKCFITQTWRLDLNGWVGPVGLRVEPVQAVAVYYMGADGEEHTLPTSNYVLHTGVGTSPVLQWIGSLPALGSEFWPVRVEITAGNDAAMPDQKVAILLRAADLYANREAASVGGAAVMSPAYDALVRKLRGGTIV
jgi:uncharacterized phiE125 gp8 family phage protein